MSSRPPVFIIGSGPSGVACAKGLLEQDINVVMLDGGLALEPERQAALETLTTQEYQEWDPTIIASFKDRVVSDSSGVQIKYIYGSDFPYQGIDQFLPRQNHNVGHITPSLAQAGFSNIWGAALLPYTEQDIADWPIPLKALEPHYRAVLSFMHISAQRDDLAEFYPLHTEDFDDLKPSRQAAQILAQMQSHEQELSANNVFFGSSRLALRAEANARTGNNHSCIYCGLCMYGCPYGLIYSSTLTLEQLKTNPNFRYQPDVLVRKIEENSSGIKIRAQSLSQGQKTELSGQAAFLAAGTLSTTQILLQSLEAFDQNIEFKASEYFLLPLMATKKTAQVQTERMHTLAQIFLEVFDKEISEDSAHMQIYTYSDLYEKALRRMAGPLKPFIKIFEPQLLGRMLIIQGYLHSHISSHIRARLSKNVENTLILEGHQNPQASAAIKALVKKLGRARRLTGMLPLRPLLKIGLPGDGRHVGGSFPMKAKPTKFESDIFGRPYGFKRVFAVDATVLPSIPAPPITFNVMANAHRIGQAYATQILP